MSFLNRNGDEKKRNVTTCNNVYQQQYITTTSKALDEMFGGMGVPTDAVTDLCMETKIVFFYAFCYLFIFIFVIVIC